MLLPAFFDFGAKRRASFFVERAFFATVMVFGPIRDIFKTVHRNRECER